MSISPCTVLVVDDEALNLEILDEHLSDEGFTPILAQSAPAALEILEQSQHDIRLVLLDWMMPGMSGLELLKLLNARTEFAEIPVIMQTAKTAKSDIQQGIDAGAYYYLTKPYAHKDLMSIVRSALQDAQSRELTAPSETSTNASLTLTFRTLEDTEQVLSKVLGFAHDFPDIALGLNELLINAIEHGNLGITYEEKSRLNELGTWREEIESRLASPEFSDRVATLDCQRDSTGSVRIRISDQGEGFDWQPFLEMSPERAFDSHGRGIAMAKLVSFPELHYLGCGNQVEVVLQKSTE